MPKRIRGEAEAKKEYMRLWRLENAGRLREYNRYVDEFAFRLNEGDVKRHTLDRLESFVKGVAGKRLTYAALIA